MWVCVHVPAVSQVSERAHMRMRMRMRMRIRSGLLDCIPPNNDRTPIIIPIRNYFACVVIFLCHFF